MRQHDDEDDKRILRDGERMRVPITMLDSMQRAIAEDSRANGRDKILRAAMEADSGPMVTDALGGTAMLSRPGYRLGNVQRTIVDEAYRLHDEEESRRWQGCDREIEVKPVTGDARVDAYLAREEHDTNAWRGPISSGKWY
jgi:hypothetical protein